MYCMKNLSKSRPIVLITATRREMQAVLSAHAQGLSLALNAPMQISWGARSLILLITGIGLVNAAMALGALLGQRKGTLGGVVNMGIAGSFDLDVLPLGAVATAKTEIWPEFGLHTEENVDPKGLGLGHGRVHGQVVWDSLPLNPDQEAKSMGLALDPSWLRVISVSVAGVSGTRERASQLRAQTGALVENMEGFALAWACRLHGLPFLQIRTISNQVGSRSPEDWAMNKAFSRLGPVAECALGLVEDPLPGKGQ
jgi:futalosine hydrolase